MSGNRVVALIIVALIHLVVGYTLITGLAQKGFQAIVQRVTTVDIEEPEPEPEEEPPPPPEPDTAPPPPVAPPAPIQIAVAPPPIQTTRIIPPPAPPALVIPPPAPPAPPPPRFTPQDPEPRGNPGNWVTTNDYPRRAMRQELEGTTSFRLTVGTDGRVTNCQITSSSGHAELDEATCRNLERRARFRAATDGNGNETVGYYSNRVRWVIPD
jgi:protein TonB